MNHHEATLNLVQRYADGIASTQEIASLQAILRDDADARRLYRAVMQLDASLTDLADAATLCGPDSAQSQLPPKTQLATSKRTRWNSIAVVLAVATCVLLVALRLWPEREETVREETSIWATVLETGPGVRIIHDGRSQPARLGDQLQTDQLITVPPGSTAQLTIAGLGTATLGPDSRLRLGSEPQSVELDSGFAAIAAEKQSADRPWRIRTPQVEAAVLGTEFNIASAKGRTVLRVAEGLVQLTSLHGGQEEQIRGGNRAIVVAGSATDVTTSRPGSVLLLTSRKPLGLQWEKFNQLLVEKLVSTRMWRLGFRVDVRHYDEVQAVDLKDRSLVIVSLFPYDIGEPAIDRIALAKADVPVICLEPAAYPVLGMSVPSEGVGFGFRSGSSPVEFIDSAHRLSGGYVGQQDDLIRGIIGWGRPENEAERIAHIPGHPEQSVVFGYDTGRQMATFPAPERRVGLFLDPIGISEQTTKTWTVFEAAVDWCVATEATKL